MKDFNSLFADAIESGKGFEEAAREASRMMAEEAVNILLRGELTGLLGYEKHSPDGYNSGNSRNGSYKRKVATSLGEIEVDVPRDRNGEFSPALFPRYSRRTEVITSAIMKLVSAGGTASEIAEIVESIYGASYSKSAVSAIAEATQAEVEAFCNSRLPERVFALYLDGTYLPVRRDTVEKEAMMIALAVTEEGERRILGFLIRPSETAEGYRDLLSSLRERGLDSVRIVVSDGLHGIDSAIRECYPDALRQRCFVHLARNMASRVRARDKEAACGEFMELARKSSRSEAEEGFRAFASKWSARYPRLAVWAQKAENMFSFYEFGSERLRRIAYTSNAAEAINKQLKRMLKKHIQFMGEDSLARKAVAVFERYNLDPSKRRIRAWKDVVEEMGK